MDARHRQAMSWALDGNHLRVYPSPIEDDIYTTRKSKNGKPKQVAINKVRLVIEIGNSKHLGKFVYKQDVTMTNAIAEIYLHYYNIRTI
tara:strand:+ start:418 stop:684 length:267 start_codon:yes stop_codon:yes gene_type:complete